MAWHVDRGETGKHADRPAFREALERIADCGSGWAHCSQTRPRGSLGDRLRRPAGLVQRRPQDTGESRPPLDTSTPSGRLVANAFSAVAEWEGDVIADRTSAALQAKRATGPISPGRPVVIDDSELAAHIRALRDDGATLAAIAEALTAERAQTVRGGERWRASSVQSVLGYKRPAARGKRTDLPVIKPPHRGSAQT